MSAHRPATLLLTRGDVRRLLPLSDCVDAVEAAFRRSAEAQDPPPRILGMHVPDGGFHAKAAVLGHYFATKLNANFPLNPGRTGLPTIQGVVILADTRDGRLLAIMDSIEITILRTAAATALAARYLARPDAAIVTVRGCGAQGAIQLEALDLGGAVRRSDIVVTCTPAHEVLIHANDVQPGTFIAAVGADSEDKQELDPTLLTQATVVVDSLEQCATIGELHHALEAGLLTRAAVHAELGQVIAGRRPSRASAHEITIFDSIGTALQDVAAAAMVYERALVAGAGTTLDLSL